MPTAAALRLVLGPSPRLGNALALGYASIAVLCWLIPLDWWLSLGLSTAVVVSMGMNLRQHAWRNSRGAWVGLELRENGSIAVLPRDGHWLEARLLGSSVVSSMLAVLHFAVPGRYLPWSLIVPGDCLSTEEFRRLRVWLRWRALRPSTADPQ